MDHLQSAPKIAPAVQRCRATGVIPSALRTIVGPHTIGSRAAVGILVVGGCPPGHARARVQEVLVVERLVVRLLPHLLDKIENKYKCAQLSVAYITYPVGKP